MPDGQRDHSTAQQQIVYASEASHDNLSTSSGAPEQITPSNPSDDGYPKYKSKAAKVVGILQIVLGSCIITAVIAIYTIVITTASDGDSWGNLGTWGYSGFLAPIFPIFAGVFGVHSAKTKAFRPIVATMVFSIFSSLVIILIVAQAGIAFANLSASHYTWESYIILFCFGVMLVFGCVAYVVAIVAAAYCFHGCCGQSTPGSSFPQVPNSARMQSGLIHDHPTSPPQPQIVIAQANIYHRYKAQLARNIGICQIVIGILILTAQTAQSILVAPHLAGWLVLFRLDFLVHLLLSVGYWIVPLFIIAGGFGVQSSKTKSRCSVITTLVLSALSAFFAVGGIAWSAVNLTLVLSQEPDKVVCARRTPARRRGNTPRDWNQSSHAQ